MVKEQVIETGYVLENLSADYGFSLNYEEQAWGLGGRAPPARATFLLQSFGGYVIPARLLV